MPDPGLNFAERKLKTITRTMYTSHQRAGDFIAAFERLWRQLSGERPVSEEFAIGEALRMPAGRFYVCRNHAYKANPNSTPSTNTREF